jgi:gamma-glutamyltranspeptidase/glutathione hydrolase
MRTLMRCVGRPILVLCAVAVAACASKPTSLAAPNSAAATATGAVAATRPITASSYAGRFQSGAVAADHELASAAGAEMLALGGNAVDAAVATSFALSVVRPYSCGIGGGGFMVIHLPSDPKHGSVSTAINYRETCPAAVGPDFYEKQDDPKASTRGGKAVAVPGTVAGLLHALENYGTLDRRTVLAPAIRLAQSGFAADKDYAARAADIGAQFRADPELQTRFAFVWERFLNRGNVEIGTLIRLPEQARALELIAMHGAAGFYGGELAAAIRTAVSGDGGVMTASDLQAFSPREVEPLKFGFAVWQILNMPPPSSGGTTMAAALGIFEHSGGAYELRAEERWTARSAHLFTESLRHAFADRSRWLGDPEFGDVPVARLLADANIARMAGMVEPDARLAPDECGTPQEELSAVFAHDDRGTSHLCAVDQWGGAVACTETINLEFGSLLAVPEFGFCLNNEMDDFLTRRGEANAFGLTQSERNLPAPGKRPLSSMSPTIVLDEAGQVIAIAGASGGPRIITGTAQALLNALVLRKSASDSVASPRFHHQWSPDVLRYEAAWASTRGGSSMIEGLQARGHDCRELDGAAGVVQLIVRDKDGGWNAASDPRKGGKPAGH